MYKLHRKKKKSILFQHMPNYLWNSKYLKNNFKLLKYITWAMANEQSFIKWSFCMLHMLELCIGILKPEAFEIFLSWSHGGHSFLTCYSFCISITCPISKQCGEVLAHGRFCIDRINPLEQLLRDTSLNIIGWKQNLC